MKYFSADLHLFDEDILRYRGLSSMDAYHELIRCGLEPLTPEDDLYILGDITMTKPWEAVNLIWTHCKAHIHLIPGNHDNTLTLQYAIQAGWDIQGSMIVEIGGKVFICTHYPVHQDELQWFDGNLHGHIHAANPPYYEPYHWPNACKFDGIARSTAPYLNVNVEFQHFSPVDEDEVKFYFDR